MGNPLPLAGWEAVAEVVYLLRRRRRRHPGQVRRYRLSRAVAPRSMRRQLSQNLAGGSSTLPASGPRGEAEPPQEERSPLWEALAVLVPWGGTG